MAILNITYAGLSADFPLESGVNLTDGDVRRIAVEVVRAGCVRGAAFPSVADSAFDHYVVDRFTGPSGERRIYLRPKVPFGGRRSA
ncbi:MAG: hypothetical protein IPM79_28440 [Polyangiaceae bacterium]|nr:hypothetical protein [Polyangiaceae bacterium]